MFFVREGYASSVVERRLRHVVEQAVEELLGVALLADHEVVLATYFKQKLDTDRFHLVTTCIALLDDSSDVALKNAERAELIGVRESLLDNGWTFILLGEEVPAVASGVLYKV